MPEHQNFNSTKGISIIELLIVIVIIGVGIAALLSFGLGHLEHVLLRRLL